MKRIYCIVAVIIVYLASSGYTSGHYPEPWYKVRPWGLVVYFTGNERDNATLVERILADTLALARDSLLVGGDFARVPHNFREIDWPTGVRVISTRPLVIDERFAGLVRMKTFEVHSTIKRFSARLHLPRVKEVVFSKFGPGRFPGNVCQWEGLETLVIVNDRISTLPAGIGRLRKLQALVLSGEKISSLPDEFYSLKELKDVSLYSKKLTLSPLACKLTKLKTFYVYDDCELEMDEETKKCLEGKIRFMLRGEWI
jgi:hypothetical protein